MMDRVAVGQGIPVANKLRDPAGGRIRRSKALHVEFEFLFTCHFGFPRGF